MNHCGSQDSGDLNSEDSAPPICCVLNVQGSIAPVNTSIRLPVLDDVTITVEETKPKKSLEVNRAEVNETESSEDDTGVAGSSTTGPGAGSMTEEQKSVLLDFLEANPDAVLPRWSRGHAAHTTLWQEMTQRLNACPGGVQRDVFGWKRTWDDLQRRERRKVRFRPTPTLLQQRIARIVADSDDLNKGDELFANRDGGMSPEWEDGEDERQNEMNCGAERKKTHLTYKQKVAMLSFMEAHPEMNRPANSRTHRRCRQLWDEMTKFLNGFRGGARRKPRGWRKCWDALKAYSKVKLAAAGRSPSKVRLNLLHQRILWIIAHTLDPNESALLKHLSDPAQVATAASEEANKDDRASSGGSAEDGGTRGQWGELWDESAAPPTSPLQVKQEMDVTYMDEEYQRNTQEQQDSVPVEVVYRQQEEAVSNKRPAEKCSDSSDGEGPSKEKRPCLSGNESALERIARALEQRVEVERHKVNVMERIFNLLSQRFQ